MAFVHGKDSVILLNQHNAQKKHWFMNLIHNYLFFKIPLIKPDPFLDKTLHIAKFFGQRFLRFFIYIIGIMGIYFVIQQWDEFLTTFLYFWVNDEKCPSFYTQTRALYSSSNFSSDK